MTIKHVIRTFNGVDSEPTEVVETDVSEHYANLRAGAYPDVGDQLDAIWKELNYRRLSGEKLTQDADDMLQRVLSVKAKYPKPE